MHLLSINRGELRTITNDGPPRSTGIFKFPVAGAVAIGDAGVPGDVIVATKHHGGPDQAIYMYGEADYAWWQRELGRDLPPGMFGENLTIAGYASADSLIGDRFTIGELVLEISAPRIPCGNLGARMEDPEFPRRFRAAERPGVYCRVIRAGTVSAGDPVRSERARGSTVSVLEVFREHYEPATTPTEIARFLAAPISERARRKKERQLSTWPTA